MHAPQPKLDPMGIETAKILVTRILAGYPYLNAHDPDGYRRALEEVMSGYPRWAGERCILKVDEQRPEFPPSDRVLKTWLDDAMRPYRFRQEWQTRTAEQLKERAEIERLEAEKGPATEGPRGQVYDAKNFHEAIASHCRPFGPFEPGRQLPYRS